VLMVSIEIAVGSIWAGASMPQPPRIIEKIDRSHMLLNFADIFSSYMHYSKKTGYRQRFGKTG
jgi:hypothetical protein